MYETKFHPLGGGLDGDRVLADGRFEGYASLFDRPDRTGDVVAPGAFSASLSGRETPVKLLWQHDAATPIGVWEEITEDAAGLKVRGRLALEARMGRDAAALLAIGAVDGLSIGYRAVRAEKIAGGRRLLEIGLWEISLVTFPMLPAARADKRPHPAAEPAPRDARSDENATAPSADDARSADWRAVRDAIAAARAALG